MWQDGLLIDFLQKKILDKWIRRFLVYSSYLFSERVLFEFVVRFYVDFIVWPYTAVSALEFSNVSLTLMGLISAILAIILLFNLNYIYILCM
jgi:small-conductance mechanosensitive channel